MSDAKVSEEMGWVELVGKKKPRKQRKVRFRKMALCGTVTQASTSSFCMPEIVWSIE
jgi:hypothetical protein